MWNVASIPGTDVAAAGFGLTALFALIGIKSSSVIGVFVTGHSPLSCFLRVVCLRVWGGAVWGELGRGGGGGKVLDGSES